MKRMRKSTRRIPRFGLVSALDVIFIYLFIYLTTSQRRAWITAAEKKNSGTTKAIQRWKVKMLRSQNVLANSIILNYCRVFDRGRAHTGGRAV